MIRMSRVWARRGVAPLLILLVLRNYSWIWIAWGPLLLNKIGTPAITEKNTSHNNNNNNADDDDDNSTVLNCLEQRGDQGRWVQDWQYANRTNYPNHGSYNSWHIAAQNFTPTAMDQPYLPFTSFVWHDDQCPVSEINPAGFCQTCQDLNVTRILVVGDSMSIEFSRAITSLLGHPLPKGPASRFQAHFRPVTIPCPNRQPAITILCARRSSLENWQGLAEEAQRYKEYRNGTLPYAPKPSKERQFIAENLHRTAIVANLGLWLSSTSDYEIAFEGFLQWMGSLPSDLVLPFFRASVPGHPCCQPNEGVMADHHWNHTDFNAPFADYAEYTDSLMENSTCQSWSVKYHWDLMDWYNQYSRQRIRAWETTTMIKTHWLNVFNSTVLRRDGHIGWDDCLHYYLPGPPDWWVHFFYSALRDVAAQQPRETNTTFLQYQKR